MDIQKQLEELEAKLKKEAGAEAKAEIEKQVEDVKTAFKVKLDEQDKALDEMSAKLKAQQEQGKPIESFHSQLEKGLVEATDDLNKLYAGERNARASFRVKVVGDIVVGNVTGSTVWASIAKPGIIEASKRKVHMRDILNVSPVGTGTDYYFMRQNGPGEGDPAPTAETATKPQFDYDLVESSVKIETIAGWVRISRKALRNVPGMMAFLNSRLPESLLKVEDSQVLYGTGTSPQIKGILTSGNFTASASASTVLVEQIIDDLARLEDEFEREANFIIMRPKYLYSFYKQKASTSGLYNLPMNVTYTGSQMYISGVPVFGTTALLADDYVVGDKNGADLLIQQDYRIEIFYEDGTNVRENKVTIRIEEDIALPVYGSDYFIKGDVADASSI